MGATETTINIARAGIHEANSYLGRSLVTRALKNDTIDFWVTAVCHKVTSSKNSNQLAQFVSHPNLKLIFVDIFSSEQMKGIFYDCDVIISCIGGRRSCSTLPTRTTLYSEATKVLLCSLVESESRKQAAALNQMRGDETSRTETNKESAEGVSQSESSGSMRQPLHLIYASTWGTKSLLDKWDQAREPRVEVHFKQCIVSPSEFRNNVVDLDAAETLLLDSDVNPFKPNTTIVRAPEIVNENDYFGTSCETRNRLRIHIEENKSYVLDSRERISADDFSKFLLRCVTEKLCNGKVIAIGLFD